MDRWIGGLGWPGFGESRCDLGLGLVCFEWTAAHPKMKVRVDTSRWKTDLVRSLGIPPPAHSGQVVTRTQRFFQPDGSLIEPGRGCN